ncbi:A disintegrin and metalloproteinase with thrombospondin motifs adt-2-like [Portunus trituberculatus]|nr:A disintegrin and metalloproteinase with thrombospondin motifs adt-2-like [Portunus trituberculatus]
MRGSSFHPPSHHGPPLLSRPHPATPNAATVVFVATDGCYHTGVDGRGAACSLQGRETVPVYSLVEPHLEFPGGQERNKRSSVRKRDIRITEVPEQIDSQPLLRLQALGKTFNFKLHPNNELVSPHFAFVGRRGEQVREVRELGSSDLGCYYHGVDQTEAKYPNAATIAVELCGHVRGVIHGPSQEYIIEPLPSEVTHARRRRSLSATSDIPTHILYTRVTALAAPEYLSRPRRSFMTGQEARAAMGERTGLRSYYDSYEHVVDSHLRSEWDDLNPGRSYDRDETGTAVQGTKDLYVETSVFVDRDLYRHMLENFPKDTEEQVLKVVLAMVNAVQLLYNDESLGYHVKFVLKRLEILYTDPPGLYRPYDIDQFLTNFCLWQRGENPARDGDALHWDHALILTGLDVFTITPDGKVNAQVVGLAPVAGMCTRSSSCTVNEGRHFESVYVMAHEIGHNLGMRHDGLQAGNNCDPGRYIMSPTLGSGKITWSSCSRRYLDAFLRSSQASCLMDAAEADGPHLDHDADSLPGQRFPVNQQCMLKHGVGSYHASTQKLEDICEDLHCRRDHYTWTSHPALEGTTCGHRQWCRRGKCVEDSNAPGLSQELLMSSSSSNNGLGSGDRGGGAGGEWGPWSECRSSCLYGVDGALSSGSSGLALSERRCRTCREEYRYRLCSAVEECGTGQRRTVQDFAHDICQRRSRSMPLLTGLAKRVPLRGPTQCEVECETMGHGVQSSDRSFPDGTVCQSASNFPAFCVAGVCTEFRCEPDALYGADPVTCRPDMGAPDPYRPLGPNPRPPAFTTTRHPATSTFASGDRQWGAWRPASNCRFSCLTPAMGIQLVSRKCLGRGCYGVNRNIQVCSPGRQHDCDRMQTPFEYASDVCRRFKASVSKLSGVGMQLASTQDDPDRSCTVACQDAELDYRFYRVKGRDGWFPFGTECTREQQGAQRSYCLNGRCLDFSDEGTPLRNTIYTEYEKGRALDLEPIERASPLEFQRREPYASPWRRARRDVTSSSHAIASTLSDRQLLSLVDQINQTITSRERAVRTGESLSSIDLKNPLFVNQIPPDALTTGGEEEAEERILNRNRKVTSHTLHPYKPGASSVEYQWRVHVSPCSVTCGRGLEEEAAVCFELPSEEAVEAWRCFPTPAPIAAGFRACWGTKRTCSATPPNAASTVIGRWLMTVLRGVTNSPP